MLNNFPVALLVGTILGFLAGLGVGGGSLLILWLTVVCNTPYAAARIVNLLFFLPSAAIACYFRRKQGSLPLNSLLPAIVSGCVAAAGTSLLCAGMDLALLKKGFGFLLIFTGIRELRYKQKTEEP